MTGDLFSAVFEILFGPVFAIHCSRAAIREYRGGIAEGRTAHSARATQPAAFWATVAATGVAAVLGGAFLPFGIATAILLL